MMVMNILGRSECLSHLKFLETWCNYYPTETRSRSDVAHSGTKLVTDKYICHKQSTDGDKMSHYGLIITPC